jgi:hypothetical protein
MTPYKKAVFFIVVLFVAIDDACNTFQTKDVSLYSIIYKCIALASISHALHSDKWKKLFNDRIIKIFTMATSLCNGIRCDTFYSRVLSKYAINNEIKKRVKKQSGSKQSGSKQSGSKQVGGMGFGWVFSAIICAISTIGVSANVVNSDDFVSQIKVIRETNVLADTKANVLGTCGHNSLVAMICAGMCPTDAELRETYPTIYTDITNEMQRIPTSSDITTLKLTIGLIPPMDFTPVKSNNIEWIRNYFTSSDLDKSNIDTADIAITTAHIQRHEINILYNRINHKLCIHDENYETIWDSIKQQYIMANTPSYFCEPQFFTQAQLDITGNAIQEVPDPIMFYNKPILQILADTFKISNIHNTGTLDDYIAISLAAKQASINGMISALNIKIQNPDPNLNPDYIKTYANSASNLFNEYLITSASPSVRLNRSYIDTTRANANAELDKIPKYSEAKLLKDIEYKKRMEIEADIDAKNAAAKQIKIDKMTPAEYEAYKQHVLEEMHKTYNEYAKNYKKYAEMYKTRDMEFYEHVSEADYIKFIIEYEGKYDDNNVDLIAFGIRKNKKKKTQKKKTQKKKTQKKKTHKK